MSSLLEKLASAFFLLQDRHVQLSSIKNPYVRGLDKR